MTDLVERDIRVEETFATDGTVVRRLAVHCDRHGGTTYVAVCAVCPGCVGFLLPSSGRCGAVLCRSPGGPAASGEAEASGPPGEVLSSPNGG